MKTVSEEQDREIRIGPKRARFSVEPGELWRYREVFYLLAWRDFKVKYKQTVLGLLWVFIQPVLATLIFTVIFASFGRFQSEELPYWLLALSGFTVWMFISSSVTLAAGSLIHHENLVTKVYFPRMIVPSASVIAALPDLILTFVVLFAAASIFGFAPGWKAIITPLIILYLVGVTLSVSLLLSALNVRFRDMKFVTPFFVQIWMFASPVFYSSGWVPDRFRLVFALNPVSSVIDLVRYSLFEIVPDWNSVAVSLISAVVIALVSIGVFRSLEDQFADVL